MLEEMANVEEAEMVPVSISPVIDMTVTVNLRMLRNIFILLMKIQSLIFLVQPGSSEKSVSSLLRSRMGSKIAPTLPLHIVFFLLKKTNLSTNLMK